MTFGEKLRLYRQQSNMTQQELADKSTVSRRSIIDYEQGKTKPKSKFGYELIAKALDIDVSSLYDDETNFLNEAEEKYGLDGRQEADRLVREMGALFAGGTLSEKDLDGVMKAIQQHYWKAKEKSEQA